jgi:hypothetical protein
MSWAQPFRFNPMSFFGTKKSNDSTIGFFSLADAHRLRIRLEPKPSASMGMPSTG